MSVLLVNPDNSQIRFNWELVTQRVKCLAYLEILFSRIEGCRDQAQKCLSLLEQEIKDKDYIADEKEVTSLSDKYFSKKHLLNQKQILSPGQARTLIDLFTIEGSELLRGDKSSCSCPYRMPHRDQCEENEPTDFEEFVHFLDVQHGSTFVNIGHCTGRLALYVSITRPGAKRVLGVEYNQDRYRESLLLKERVLSAGKFLKFPIAKEVKFLPGNMSNLGESLRRATAVYVHSCVLKQVDKKALKIQLICVPVGSHVVCNEPLHGL